MDDARKIENDVENAAADATGLAEEAIDTAEAVIEEVDGPKGALEDTLADALASVRRAIVQQPITAVLLVGAFAFLYGLNRRS